MALQPSVFANERRGRRRILLVEDEPFVREATCSILQNAGFEVLPAEDAGQAMKMYEECGRSVDLVMTDMVLPGRTGQQLGQDVRKRSPEIAVLVTSGYGEAGYETEVAEARTYFLAKPYSRRALLEKIETILETALKPRATTQAS
jgi:two-component system cell cycle sensor histidine kinase/response regulator CckA